MNKTSKRIGITAFIINLLQIMSAPVAYSGIGISTRFVDVTIEFVEVGKIYNLRQLRNMPYTVKNRSTIPMDIGMEIMVPSKKELMPGYEAIPDTSWIQIIPNKIRAESEATVYAELIIQVPDDKAFVGRHYQAKIRAMTLGSGLFAASTEGRFRFSTGAGPETLKEEAKKHALLTLDFDVTPADIFIDGVTPGKSFNVKKENRRTLKVTNRAENPLKMKFISVVWDSQRFTLPGDYEAAPDPSWLKFVPEAKIIGPDKIESLEPIIEIPIDEQHYGKKYAFLVKADIIMGVELEVFNKIFVKVKEKGQ